MMKRIIALLLALILTVGLLPTVALAADGENPTTDSGSVTKEASKDNLNLVKTVTKEGDNYKVTLESWATGTVTTTTKTKPLDIVLLLDVSGSMVDKYSDEKIDKYVPYDYNWYGGPIFGGYDTTNSDLYGYQSTQYGVWHKLSDGTYVTVKVDVEKHKWKYIYTYSYTSNGKTTTIEKSEGANDPPKTQFYYKESADTTKLDALKTAVSAFIDNVATNSPNSNISIVKFADDSYKDTEGNDFYSNGYNYTQIVKKLTKVDTKGVAALKKAIDELKAGGATASDYGLNKAQEALKDAKQERVVILFTDGEPNYHDGFDKKVATNAVNKAKELKTATTKTTIYTVGVFKNLSEDVNLYMSSVSSNYPNASAQYNNKGKTWKVSDGGSDFGKYYMNATSPVDLLKAFETISSEVSGGELGAKAVLTDVIAPNFALVALEGTTGVTAYTVDKTADGWSTQKTTLTNGVTVGAGGQVSVTGFDYSENCVTTTAKPNTTNDYGKKLVVEFTIHHNNYGGTQPTNAGASIKDEEGKEVIKVDDPTVPVKITKPSITGASATKVYDGTGIDVLANVAAEADKLVTGENKGKNAFVDIIVKVKDEAGKEYTYTIPAGETTGSWSPENTGFKTLADVKIVSGVVSDYTYGMTITFEDATDNGAPKAIENATATYTITKRPVTLTSETASKSYDGTPLTKPEVTVTDYNDGKNVFDSEFTAAATGTITKPGGPVVNTITVTPKKDGALESNYEITKQEGNLTITRDDTTAITVTITGNHVEAPYDGQEHTASGYTVTYPDGTTANDFSILLNGTASMSATDVKTTAEGTVDADGRYMMGLTAEDFTVTSEKYGKIKVTYTDGWVKINPRAVTLTSATHSWTYGDVASHYYTDTHITTSEATGNFVNGEALVFSDWQHLTEIGQITNTFNFAADTTTNMKLTNYVFTKVYGTLTVTLPDPSIPTVTVDCINHDVSHSDKTDITLTAATQYELGDPQKVTNESAYTRTITLTDAGKEYCIGDYNEDIAGHTKAAGGTTTITLKYSKEGSDWTWRAPANFLVNVQCNTPTVNVNLGNYIKKTLTGTNFHENFEATFTVEVTYTDDNDSGTATGSVRFTGADTKDFGFVSTVELKKNHVYKFTATELADNVPGVDYDTRTYSFALKITAEGDVVFGSVVEGVFVADKTDNKYVTITNTYTKPAYKIEKNVITDTSVKIPAWSLDYPDPVEIKVVVDADQQEIVLGYVIKITGSAGASFTLTEDEGSQFVTVHNADGEFTTVTPGKKLSFTLTQDHGNEHPILIYTTKVISRDPETGAFPAKVKNVVTEEDDTTHESGETTIEERGTLTVDFGALVRKHLTVTGDKSFNGATFTVNFTDGTFIKNEKENEPEISSVEVYAADAGVNERGLPNLTASVTYGADERNAGYKPFDGADLTIRVEGTYFYLVSEVIPDGATGYDTNKYIIGISVENDGDHLEVAGVGYSKYIENSQENPEITWNEGPTFHNTIDTGKDDYYPIIIPTIINKDTGMLNKTDHFAYVIGYPDGTVHPNGQITRAEVATIFFRLLRDEVRDGAFTTSNTYSDVAYGKWYNNPISTMSALGIITGYPDDTFKPNKPITRAEFAAIAARFDETQSGKSATFSDVIGHWAAKEIGIAYYNDWIKGYPDGTFKPDQNITRAEAMTLINRVLERKPESPADLLTNMNKWTDNMDTSKWYYLDVQEATNSHGYTRKTFNYELWRQMLPDPDWSRYER